MEGKRLSAAAMLISLFLAGVMWSPNAVCAQTGSVTGTAVEDMQIVSPGSGWVLDGHKLYWTSDNGQNWDDITPGNDQQPVSKVFFLDVNRGWAILPGNDDTGASITIASTRNGGKSWQSALVAIDSVAQGRRIGEVASMYFADTQQGWLILHLSSSSNFSIGAAMHTEDGGLTWAALPPPPAAGNIVFLTS